MSEPIDMLTEMLTLFRRWVEPSFSAGTASPGSKWTDSCPSTGHCAVVSILVLRVFGGEYVSATVDGMSHWFNRLDWFGRAVDVDLTGDQFGRRPVQVADAGGLYPDTRVRLSVHINENTIDRYVQLTAWLRRRP